MASEFPDEEVPSKSGRPSQNTQLQFQAAPRNHQQICTIDENVNLYMIWVSLFGEVHAHAIQFIVIVVVLKSDARPLDDLNGFFDDLCDLVQPVLNTSLQST